MKNLFKYHLKAIFFTLTMTILPLCSSGSASAVSLETNYLPNGKYTIMSMGGLDVTTGKSNVNLHANTGSYEGGLHEVRLQRDNNGFYTITNVATGKAMDVAGASRTNGANIQMYTPNGTCAQKWAFQTRYDNVYTIRNACSGNAMDAAGGAIKKANTNIQTWAPNGTKAQDWQLIRTDACGTDSCGRLYDNKLYSIRASSGKSLDISGGIFLSGINMQIWDRNNTNAQQFKVYTKYDDSITIANKWGNMAVDVAGASKNNGANVQLWRANNTCAQKWFAERSGGAYVLKNSCSGKALDVSGGAIYNRGANVQLWTPNGTQAQKWTFTRL